MKLRALIVLALVGAIVALTPLAFASPPDETWLGGLWDDDDFDTVILLVMSSSHAITSLVVHDVAPIPVVAFDALQTDATCSPPPPILSHDCRAPPTA